ncbi:MAG: alkaline phosphatase family protein [Clostridia bacterium]|nr:alkaline phosphatase family protein [Clostridia bacterium]
MGEKVILMLVDGMRPDAFTQCGHPFAQKLMERSAWSMAARTVFPSVTLPCHMSLFHSVDPERHGILTNTYVPQARPIEGLFDRLHAQGKKTAFFCTWEPLRDLGRPGSLTASCMLDMFAFPGCDARITDEALRFLQGNDADFLFLYLGDVDEIGHEQGWMSAPYMDCVRRALDCAQRVFDALPEDATFILTADHGGHARLHGTETPEDMTIPLLISGPRFAPGEMAAPPSIKDIPATVAELLSVSAPRDWEGRSVL